MGIIIIIAALLTGGAIMYFAKSGDVVNIPFGIFSNEKDTVYIVQPPQPPDTVIKWKKTVKYVEVPFRETDTIYWEKVKSIKECLGISDDSLILPFRISETDFYLTRSFTFKSEGVSKSDTFRIEYFFPNNDITLEVRHGTDSTLKITEYRDKWYNSLWVRVPAALLWTYAVYKTGYYFGNNAR